ncbi:MAG: hypothetical protein RIC35_24090 [Marinoscillum sp.]
MKKKKEKTKEEVDQKPKVNKDLEGFDVSIDSFGELKSTIAIDQINQFLNKNVDDKKLRDREDLDKLKGKK